MTKNALQGLRLWQKFPCLITHPFGNQGYALVVSPLLPQITCWLLAQENLIRRLAGLVLLTKTDLCGCGCGEEAVLVLSVNVALYIS